LRTNLPWVAVYGYVTEFADVDHANFAAFGEEAMVEFRARRQGGAEDEPVHIGEDDIDIAGREK